MLIRKIFNKINYWIRKYKASMYEKKLNNAGGHLHIAPGGKVTISTGGKISVKLGENITLWDGVKISVWGTPTETAELQIGSGVNIGDRTQLHVGKKLIIGDGTLISWDCCIMDRDYHKYQSDSEQKEAVIIGPHVWIGNNVIILKGVSIGEGSVVASGSVVTHDVPKFVTVAGNPAKVIQTEVSWQP